MWEALCVCVCVCGGVFLAVHQLTSVGEVTLMSGAAAASNRLTMFSAFISLDGVTFGGGGTAGFSCTGTEARQRAVRFLLHHQTSGPSRRFCLEKQPLATLDGDLGIGGGPPGLRVWLEASLTLVKCRHATFQSKVPHLLDRDRKRVTRC